MGGISRQYRSCSAQCFTLSECVIPPWFAAKYALLVRILALVLGQFAPVVRTPGSQPPLREPGNYN